MIKTFVNKYSIIPLIFLIRVYQFVVSPVFNNNCRYLPTCSEYSINALKVHGPIKGLYYSSKRIIRCHPFGGQGFDPVPKKTTKEF